MTTLVGSYFEPPVEVFDRGAFVGKQAFNKTIPLLPLRVENIEIEQDISPMQGVPFYAKGWTKIVWVLVDNCSPALDRLKNAWFELSLTSQSVKCRYLV